MDYKILQEEQVVEYAKHGDEQALDFLIQKYRGVATGLTRSYFLIGGDQDDLMQEAMIGLYKACLSYDKSCGASFATFARKCITRNVQSAVKSANRKKFQLLNNSLNLSSQGEVVLGEDEDDEELTLFIPSSELMPEEVLIEEEKLEEIKNDILGKLSKFELKVLKYYLKGLTYIEIAEKLKELPKSIDNALNRIKTKLSYLKK